MKAKTMARSRLPRIAATVLLTSLLPLAASAEDKTVRQIPATPAPAGAPSAEAVAAAARPMVQFASETGIKTCLPRVQLLATDLASRGAFAPYLMRHGKAPDAHLYSGAIETLGPNNVGFVSFDAAPAAGGCDLATERIMYWQNTCAEVTTALGKSYQPKGVLAQNISVLEANAFSRVYLMPAGTGCVTIARTLIY